MKFYLSIFLFLLISSCDAPRDNLLDPFNPDNTIHTIEGIVQTTAVPFQPIEDVSVSVKGRNYVTETNTTGNFLIELYDNPDVTIYFEKNGYHKDSSNVTWDGRKNIFLTVHLNAKPRLDSVSFYSVVQFKYPDDKIITFTIKAMISDAEFDDINSVSIENSFYNLNKTLNYNSSSRFYEQSLTSNDLHTVEIEGVIGKDFNIIVKDTSTQSLVVGTSSIKRIINQQPEFISPANNIDTITVAPTLRWKRYDAQFNFYYHVQIYTNEIWPSLVWEKDNISSTEINIDVDRILLTGEYFWVIWCIDEFQNRVRSKPASFKVVQ